MKPVLLLVEDNAIDEELTLRALRKANVSVDVVVARDGAAALDYLFSTGAYAGRDRASPAVVMLDLNLPKLSGLEVLRRIRARPEMAMLRIVVMTSSSEHRDVIGAYDGGANSYVVKPVESAEFSQAVRQLAEYWLGVNVVATLPQVRSHS